MDVSIKDRGAYAFGRFRLDPMRRTLQCGDEPIKLVPRLFDLLLYLVENPGRVVEKDELLGAVWGGRIVEEANLSQAISALRKVLQADGSDAVIVTAPGRGYRFTAPVQPAAGGADAAQSGQTPNRVAPRGFVAAPAEPRAAPPWWRRTTTILASALGLVLVAWFVVGWQLRPTAPVTSSGAAAFAPPPHSIAVLAFDNISGDPGQAYFADGLAAELIDALGRIDGVRVAARTSAFSFKNSHATIDDIARKLNVGAVLEGSVRRDGNRLRISVDLTDATTGFALWSHQYDRDQVNILQLQSELAAAVISALQIKLLGNDVSQLTLGGTSNGRAFDAFLRGQNLYLKGPPFYQAAVAADDEAVSLDPGYALAYGARAHTLCEIANMSAIPKSQMVSLYDSALQSAEHAVALAPNMGTAHAQLAWVLENCAFDFARADAEMSRALALAPGNADVLDMSAFLQMYSGHTDAAVVSARRMVALDPVNAARYLDLAVMLYEARQFDDAATELHRVAMLGAAPTFAVLSLQCMVALARGDLATAIAASASEQYWNQNLCLAVAYHRMGKQKEADAQAAKVHALLGDSGPFQYAMLAAQFGDEAGAVQWLETAYKVHDSGIIGINTEFMLDPIHHTPEFKDIERRVFGND